MAWPVSIAVLTVTIVAVSVATATYLRVIHGWDRVSAFLAAAPGALSQVILVATQNQADVRGIVIVQTVRVVILATAIPIALAALGLAGTPPVIVSVTVDNPLLEYALLIGVSTAAALALEWVRFRGGLMFGALVASALLHGTGVVHVIMPWWIAAIAMCGLGAITGSRFANTGMRLMLNYIGAAFGSFVVAIGVASVFALGLAAVTNFRAADVIVSFSPGALDVMMILALALHLDPIYVGAHHLARFLLISISLPLATRMVRERQ
jgi:membrane AbrB-like protein